jgi:hypothetical protein
MLAALPDSARNKTQTKRSNVNFGWNKLRKTQKKLGKNRNTMC